MEPKKGRFGNGQTTCVACGAALAKLRELELQISHKATGKPLSTLWYAVPLCPSCGGDNSVAMSVSWGQEIDISDTCVP